jgi:L-fuculose-phosphate aldolase
MTVDPREHLCEISRIAYERRLLDSAGGNLSIREGDRIFATPRYSGSKWRWNLRPDQINIMDLDGNLLDARGELSREFQMHLAIYKEFNEAGAVFHAHPRNVLVFAYNRKPILPASEQTEKYGKIELTEAQPAHSPKLARTVVETLSRKREKLAKHAIACLIPYHGITVVGRDLDETYDALERIDGSCYVLIAGARMTAELMLSEALRRG